MGGLLGGADSSMTSVGAPDRARRGSKSRAPGGLSVCGAGPPLELCSPDIGGPRGAPGWAW